MESMPLRPEEAAEWLNIGRSKAYELMRSGHLESAQIGGVPAHPQAPPSSSPSTTFARRCVGVVIRLYHVSACQIIRGVVVHRTGDGRTRKCVEHLVDSLEAHDGTVLAF